MPSLDKRKICTLVAMLLILGSSTNLVAEPNDDTPYGSQTDQAPPPPNIPDDAPQSPAPRTRPRGNNNNNNRRGQYQKPQPRKYFVPDTERTDAGIFHVGFAAGGNFYVEPRLSNTDRAPTGDYFKDFGFQAGVYFDYDYSALTENVPLSLRGMIGYKYILNSVNVFDFDAMVRYMMRFSDNATFGLGVGASSAVWYRVDNPPVSTQEIIFLPSFILGAGFEYNPFMVDFKWLINRIGSDSSIYGLELYFGLRL